MSSGGGMVEKFRLSQKFFKFFSTAYTQNVHINVAAANT